MKAQWSFTEAREFRCSTKLFSLKKSWIFNLKKRKEKEGCFKSIDFDIVFTTFQENKELRLALEEHQNVMELIMSKYRQQVAKLVSVNKKQMQPNTQDQAKVREALIPLYYLGEKFWCL